MNRIQVILAIDMANIPGNFQEIVKHEQEVLFNWKQDEILEHLFLTQSKDAAVLILKGVDELKAKSMIETLPLFQYKKSVQYFSLIQQF